MVGAEGLRDAAAALSSPELKQLAFEVAVGVCDADGLRNEAETRFLAELGQALGLTLPQIAEPAATADALATMPLRDIVGNPAGATAARSDLQLLGYGRGRVEFCLACNAAASHRIRLRSTRGVPAA